MGRAHDLATEREIAANRRGSYDPHGPADERVRVRYAGALHPTMLPRMPRLAAMLRQLGAPVSFRAIGTDTVIEWAPIYPDTPIPEYRLPYPWRTFGERPRAVLSVELCR